MKSFRILLAIGLSLAAQSGFAQTIIDQNRALAGNITPGDTAGFPITLSQPGSYKLTSNLTVPLGVNGITITAADVTLDLNGFSIVGGVTCTRVAATRVVTCPFVNSSAGVRGFEGASIHNGTIKGFGSGVSLNGSNMHLERIHVTHNVGSGISSPTPETRLRMVDSVASMNGASGLNAFFGLVTGSRFFNNGENGISASFTVLLLDSIAYGNAGIGINGATVNRTISYDNTDNVSIIKVLGVNLNVDGFTTY